MLLPTSSRFNCVVRQAVRQAGQYRVGLFVLTVTAVRYLELHVSLRTPGNGTLVNSKL